jgi:hypothetical protein
MLELTVILVVEVTSVMLQCGTVPATFFIGIQPIFDPEIGFSVEGDFVGPEFRHVGR